MRDGGCIFIVAGGDAGVGDFLRSQVRTLDPSTLICADGGARHLINLGMTPHVVIGDMDSLAPETLMLCRDRGSRIIRFPRDKMETDTQLALEYALRSNPADIRIFGALGGRIDHTLANISLLALAARQKVPARLMDEWCEIFVVTEDEVISGPAGQTVSLLPLSSVVSGIGLEGFVYPLSGGTMEIGRPYGISNRLQGPRGRIAIGSGCLLVVRYHKPEGFPGGGEG